MKRLSTIIMALALVLGMSQCKKQETPTNGGDKVYITLNVSNGESLDVNVNDNGGRHAVAPNLGVIQFRNGDVLYVGNNGKYVGQLTYNNGAFGGTLYYPTSGDYLHFYFLGNAELSETLPVTIQEGTEITSRTINIADQRQNLPVLCYGHSSQPYTGSGVNYTAVLEYKCALVRFNLEKQVYMNVNLSNVLTEATIDFEHNAITPTATTGTMTLYGEEGVITHRWGILLPGTTLTGTGHSDLDWQGTGSMPTIVANGYVDAGVGAGFLIHNPSHTPPTTDVAVHNGTDLSVFSVSPTQKVYFSKANLKYTPGTNTWEFHNSQVDECYGLVYQPSYGKAYRPKQSKYNQAWVEGSSTSSMDRFCWGYNDYDNTLSETDFVTGRKDLSRTFGTDWGCAFPEGTYWRTPTASEWDYLLNNTARGNKRFMMVKFLYHKTYSGSKVYESYCNGLMLFPDNFDESGLGLSNKFNTTWYNQTDAYHLIDAAFYDDSGSNMYKLLNAGVVFLPAVGMRAGGTDWNTNNYGSSYYYIYDYYDSEANGPVSQGYYWTASCDGYETWSKYLWIGVHGGTYYALSNNTTTATETFGVHNMMNNVPNMREIGMCVRLVWDAN